MADRDGAGPCRRLLSNSVGRLVVTAHAFLMCHQSGCPSDFLLDVALVVRNCNETMKKQAKVRLDLPPLASTTSTNTDGRQVSSFHWDGQETVRGQ